MTLPPNIEEEIEKEASLHATEPRGGNSDIFHTPKYYSFIDGATQFYLKGVGDRDAIAKAAIFYTAKLLDGWRSPEEREEVYGEAIKDFLASDEYKKLVGDL